MPNFQPSIRTKLKALFPLIFGILLLSCSSLKHPETNEHVYDVALNLEDDALPFGAPQMELLDTVHIGLNQSFLTLESYFAREGKKENVYIIVHEGTYYSNQLLVDAKNIVLEGQGEVNLYCTNLYENVMWLTGENILVKNFHMKHFAPGKLEGQNCSGRVIGFDGAHNVTIENCDLNGCGLAGLHDNLGNSNILIRNNYIHNNAVGAYTNIDGDVWLKEIADHSVFHFENNRMENNGPDRTPESDSSNDFISSCPSQFQDELIQYIDELRKEWKEVPNPLVVGYRGYDMGDYEHILFEDVDGNVYDFGSANNDFGAFQSHFDDDNFVYDPTDGDPQYRVFWRWKVSTFPCCSGEYEWVDAYLPSIVQIELIDEN